jgi:hypothetical protein
MDQIPVIHEAVFIRDFILVPDLLQPLYVNIAKGRKMKVTAFLYTWQMHTGGNGPKADDPDRNAHMLLLEKHAFFKQRGCHAE